LGKREVAYDLAAQGRGNQRLSCSRKEKKVLVQIETQPKTKSPRDPLRGLLDKILAVRGQKVFILGLSRQIGGRAFQQRQKGGDRCTRSNRSGLL